MVVKLEEEERQHSSFTDLSVVEIHTLVAIGTEKPRTMTQVAGILNISVSTLTTAVNKLLKKGYVERMRDSEDRRIVKVTLTEKGREAVEEHDHYHNMVVKDAISFLSRKEAVRFATSVNVINDFLHMRNAVPKKVRKGAVMAPLRLGDITIPVPVFNGGMSMGISDGTLAGNVAKCGGAGIISATDIGIHEDDFEENPIEANKRALLREIEKANEIASENPDHGPVGVNILCSCANFEIYVGTALEAGVRMIVSGGGLPLSLPGLCKGYEGVTLIPVIASVRAAKVIMKNWRKRYKRIPEAFIFEGPLAGGQLGFKEEQLEAANETFYNTIAELKGVLAESGDGSCALIVAGGILNRKDCKKVLTCGADAVQLGTRFAVSQESGAHENIKKAYLDCREKNITVIKTPVGMPAHVLKNEAIEKILAGEKIPHSCNECLINCPGEEAQFCQMELLRKAAKGDIENGLVFCGVKARKIKRQESVEEIMQSLIK